MGKCERAFVVLRLLEAEGPHANFMNMKMLMGIFDTQHHALLNLYIKPKLPLIMVLSIITAP